MIKSSSYPSSSVLYGIRAVVFLKNAMFRVIVSSDLEAVIIDPFMLVTSYGTGS